MPASISAREPTLGRQNIDAFICFLPVEACRPGIYPRRITIADPVPGIAQPRLADTSAFFTWRQPPSR
jgi:hypothetical protein